jgi:tyrosyl-DNA phosphodiesterase-1
MTFRGTSLFELTSLPTGEPGKVSVRELVDLAGLQGALLTTFIANETFVNVLIPESVPLILVRHWYPNEHKCSITRAGNSTVIFPPIPSSGLLFPGAYRPLFHSKLMLLFYPDVLRVVVSTANLVPEDFTVIGQMAWVQDFPRNTENSGSRETFSPSSFGSDLNRAVGNMIDRVDVDPFLTNNLPDGCTLGSFDFSSAAATLIESSPQRARAPKGLPDAISHLGIGALHAAAARYRGSKTSAVGKPSGGITRYMCSSVGRLTRPFIKLICDVFGDKELRVLFPSNEHVRRIKNGPYYVGAGVLFNAAANEKPATKEMIRDVRHRDPAKELMALHTKCIVSTNEQGTMAVLYCGSHNCSVSAWGSYQTPKGTKDTVLVGQNYELGVLLIVEGKDEVQKALDLLPFVEA